MSLWNTVCSVLLCYLWEKEHLWDSLGSIFSHKGHFFLSQSAQSSLSFLAHISSSQNASGIQRSQSVIANEDTNKEAKSSLHPTHRGISVITPLPFGGGAGGGAAIFLTPCVFCSSVFSVRKICHSLFVIMSFCLKNHTCLLLSLCHYVLKKIPVFFCHYVILSKKSHLSSFVIMSLCLKKNTCLLLSLCHSV